MPVISNELSLTLRGFAADTSVAASMLARPPDLVGVKGEPVKPGVSAQLHRSFVLYQTEFPANARLDDVVAQLLDELGGVEAIAMLIDAVNPEFVQFNFMLSIKRSEEQTNAALSPSTLEKMQSLGASLSFEFV